MTEKPNIRLLAIETGDVIKRDSSVKEIDRLAQSLFPCSRDHYPNDSITSERSKLIYDWFLSLGRHQMESSQRSMLLRTFLEKIAPNDELRDKLMKAYRDAGFSESELDATKLRIFNARGFHPEVIKHCRQLFGSGHAFHAVFETAKVYNRRVQEKSRSPKDGEALMLEVWSPEKGSLKLTPCESDTDRNVQDGMKFLSAGLMRAVRNPTAHEPAVEWPISDEDALDLLSFLSFLFRQLDKAVYFSYPAPKESEL